MVFSFGATSWITSRDDMMTGMACRRTSSASAMSFFCALRAPMNMATVKPACMRMLIAAIAMKTTNRSCDDLSISTSDLSVGRRRRRSVGVLPCIDSRCHLARVFGNYFAAPVDVVLYLGTPLRDSLLATLDIVTELVLAGVDVGVDLCRRFSRFLLQVFGTFARAFG